MIDIDILNDSTMKRRTPIVAGIFYPETGAEIRAAIQKYQSMNDDTEGPCTPLALIVPHAAWDITGQLLARAFHLIQGRHINQVVLIGPLHEWHEEGIFVSDSDVFETPLGDLSVNRDKIDELLSCTTAIEINDIPHLSEHCLEVLLPWIYTSCPGASIIPILIGAHRTSHIHSLTRALELTFADCLDTTLFVITTNLSAHFDDTEAFEQSKLFLNMLQERKTEEIVSLSKSFQISACGAAGVAAFLACNFRSEALSDSPAAGVSNKPVILGQASIRTEGGKTSSVLLEEPDSSVHYAALCVPMR